MKRCASGRGRQGALVVAMVFVCGLSGCRPLGGPNAPDRRQRISVYLNVARSEPTMFSRDYSAGVAAADKEFATFKLTLAAMAKNPFVLNAALKKPGVQSLPIVASQTDVIRWLENEIHVEPSESEVVELWMPAAPGSGAERAALLNAVAEALVDELHLKSKNERTKRLKDLEEARATVERNLRKNATIIQSLRADVGTSTPEQAQQKHQFLMMVLRELYANERTLRGQVLTKQIELQQLRMQIESANVATAADVRKEAERDLMLQELTRQWGEAQRRLMEAEIVGDEQDQARMTALVDRLSTAIEQRLTVAREAAQAAVAEANEKLKGQLKSELSGGEVSLSMYEGQLKELLELKSELENDVAKTGKVSGELERYQAEHLTLQEHFKKIDNEMLVLQGTLDVPARVTLLQQATEPQP